MIFVAAAVVGALFLIGSPAHQRLIRLDERRLGHLQNIEYQISGYFAAKMKLPASLDEMNGFEGFLAPVDPESGAPYEYSVRDEMQFRLCANFSLASETEDPARSASWKHPAGRGCFDITLERSASSLKGIYPSVTVTPAV